MKRGRIDLTKVAGSDRLSERLKNVRAYCKRIYSITRNSTPAREFTLKFFYPACGINKALFPSVGGVRVHRDIPYYNMMIDPINIFGLFGMGC